jgi:hypothetical protein
MGSDETPSARTPALCEDFSAFLDVAFGILLGRPPNYEEHPHQDIRRFRATQPECWPDDKPHLGLSYLHRGLSRQLDIGGGTVAAAQALRAGLETGVLCAVIFNETTGRRQEIPSRLWLAKKISRPMYWDGYVDHYEPGEAGGLWRGDIYLVDAAAGLAPASSVEDHAQVDAAPQPDWWPAPSAKQKDWVMAPAVVAEANRRLRADGKSISSEAAKAQTMEAMAREAGRPWGRDSIAAARRKAR